MLCYFGNKFIFNFEIGKYSTYTARHIPFCDDEYVMQYFPNVLLKSSEKTSTLKNSTKCFALSPSELYTFLKKWEASSTFNKLYDWTIEEWYDSYISNVQYANRILGGETTADESAFPYRKYILTQNISYEETEPFFVFDEKLKPEFSWCVEDCLYHRLKGTRSKYISYVDKIINRNIRRNRHHFYKQNLFRRHFSEYQYKEKGLSIETMPITMDALHVLHSEHPEEIVRTNVSHLIKLIQVFNDKKI